jgi:hypothetical protein
MAKKLTKAETLQLARTHAQAAARLYTPTPAEQDAMSFAERQDKIAGIAASIMAAPEVAARTSYLAEYESEYRSALSAEWAKPVRQRDAARKEWRRLLSGLRMDDAKVRVQQLLADARIRNARITDNYDGVTIEVERTFSVSATLYVRFERKDWSDHGVTNPDADGQRAGVYAQRCELSWGGMSHGVSDALACVSLYRDLIEIAAEIEAVFARLTVVWTWGLPEPEPEEQPAETLADA